ncbi:MAG TPA: hypothetical protein PKA16_02055 [Ottowia sp.]|uniref:hypothetical protein n=1 Tax=Ottowia sp. TaxID=1898956 RepID=UPI002CAD13DE|nr:hypothetical protein [Ottowia sp.]HMN20155.1 hypothetical protein [Ottowia sp.]
MKPTLAALAAALLATGGLAGCVSSSDSAPTTQSYIAQLQPMNTAVTRTAATGTARFTVSGDRLTIDIDAQGTPPNTVHWQHFHGLTGPGGARCATMAADANHDGIVDLIETGPASGTTMVPFTQDPASMEVAHGQYPSAGPDGRYHYHQVVSLKALDAAFAKAFPGQALDLDRRVVLIHGVPASTPLPHSVQSLGPIPATTTLPIACGQIVRAG